MRIRWLYETTLYKSENDVQEEIKAFEKDVALLKVYKNFLLQVDKLERNVLVPSILRDIPADKDTIKSKLIADLNLESLGQVFDFLKECKAQIIAIEPLDYYRLNETLCDSCGCKERKISSDSGHWSMVSSGSDTSEDCSGDCCNTCGETPLNKQIAFCVRNLSSILIELQKLTDFVAKGYYEALALDIADFYISK